eukprot:COSAG01_NODE_50457_length_363_cov_0.943182_1_plen_71_part_10
MARLAPARRRHITASHPRRPVGAAAASAATSASIGCFRGCAAIRLLSLGARASARTCPTPLIPICAAIFAA